MNTILNKLRFVLLVITTFLLSYIIAFIIVGIIWDPNGVNFFDRSFKSAANIVFTGMYLNIPLAANIFLSKFHPITTTIGAGLLVFTIIGLLGIKEKTGKRIVLASVSLVTILGTIKWCLLA